MVYLIQFLKQKKYLLSFILLGLFLVIIGLYISNFQSDPNQQIIITPTPTTYPKINISTFESLNDEEKFKIQDQHEKAFAKSQADIQEEFPWYDKLPLQASTYFVYFDVDKKSFVGLLYPTDSAKNEVASQVVTIKAQVKKSLRDQDIPFTNYPFIWEIKPEEREISIISPENRTGLQSKETLPDSTIKYNYLSPKPDRPNIIITNNKDVIIFQRTITNPSLPIQISDYTETYGAVKWVFRGSEFYGSEAQTYIYPELGIAFIANPKTQEVFEQHIFTPTKIEDYVKKYGDDIPAQP